MFDSNDYVHRTLCEVVNEQRKLLQTANIFNYKRVMAILISTTEEIQSYGNRMEAALSYSRDLKELHEKRKELLEEVKLLKSEVKKLKQEAGVEESEEDDKPTRLSFRKWLSTREDD